MPTIRCNTVVAPLLGLALVPATACAEYYFDPALLQGSDFGKSLDLDRFNQRDTALPAGDYVLDVYLNNQLIHRQAPIALVKTGRRQDRGTTLPVTGTDCRQRHTYNAKCNP